MTEQQQRFKNPLVSRLFDKGVFQKMPSVSKPKDNLDRPLTSKIALLKKMEKKTSFLPQLEQNTMPMQQPSQSFNNSPSAKQTTNFKTKNGKSFIGVESSQCIDLNLNNNSSFYNPKSKELNRSRRASMIDMSTQNIQNFSTNKLIINMMDIMQGKEKELKRPNIAFANDDSIKKNYLGVSQASLEDIQDVTKDGNEKNNQNIYKLKDIDSFIQLIREHKISPMEFIYLIKSKTNSNDAYNMKVIGFNQIQDKKIMNYHTLSSKGLTKYENNIPMEFVHLGDWLKERDQFNAIKSLSFFRKFRMWKTLKKWVKILNSHINRKVSDQLNEKLLFLNPVYQKLLLKHRSLCCDLEGLRFVQTQENEAITLQYFLNKQQDERKEVVSKLQGFSLKMHENCQQGISIIIEKLKQKIQREMTNEEEQVKPMMKDTNKKNQDEKRDLIEKLGFPLNMSYGHRALMRNEFVRFLRLAYLLDFMAIQSLGRVYISTADDFLNRVQLVTQAFTDKKLLDYNTEEENKKNPPQEEEPVFTIDFIYKQEYNEKDLIINEIEVSNEQVNINAFEFDLQSNLLFQVEIPQPEEEKGKKKAKDKDKEKEKEVEIKVVEKEFTKKRVIENIQTIQLEIKPNKKEFISSVQEVFSEGMDSIQVVERWSKNQYFTQYVNALEEWDEIIGEKWSKPESNYLNPAYWIREHPIYQKFTTDIVKYFEIAYSRIKSFQFEFNELLSLVWKCENSELNQLENQQLLQQLKIFQLSYRNYSDVMDLVKKIFRDENVDIGLLKVELSDVQQILTEKQQKQMAKLEEILISLFRKRAQALKQWLQKSIKRLTGMVIKIEEFVEQKNNLDIIFKESIAKRDQIETVTGLFNFLYETGITLLKKDDKDQSQELNFLEGSLNVAISEAENNTTKNIERFKKTLRERIEKLKIEQAEILEQATHEKFLSLTTNNTEACAELITIDEHLKIVEETALKYSEYEEILQCQEITTYEQMEEAREQLNLRLAMWKSIEEFKNLSQSWVKLPFNQIQAKEMLATTEQYVRTVTRCEKNLPENKVISYLKKIVWEFKDSIPVVVALRSPYLLADHWTEIKAVVKGEFKLDDENFTFQKLLSMNVGQHQEFICEVAVKAAQEDALAQQLKNVENHWTEVDLKLKPYKESADTLVLYEIDELTQQLDEGLGNMGTILSSRYVKPLRQKAEKMQQDLLNLSEIIEKWVECQKKWMYLESIFSSPDIKKQLPQESALFDQCDKFLKGLMKKTSMHPKAIKLVRITQLLDNLIKMGESLEQIEKQLEDYLELKRNAFPRFYFLSNDELLEILAKQANLEAIQFHLPKCFEAVAKMDLGDKSTTGGNLIQGILSVDNEGIQLLKAVAARGNVETWLDTLQKEIFEALRRLSKQGIQDYHNGVNKTRNEWILAHKSQIVSTVCQIIWSINTEDSINETANKPNSIYEWFDVMVAQLGGLTQLVRGELTQIYRKIIVALITTEVHNRDIVRKLADTDVENVYDFQWQQQLRYYWEDEADDCVIKQVTNSFHYGYEFIGPTTRLVITPLTDRCWITITNALGCQLGAAPQGPAGTGKTESTKDLAKALGRLCIVFNCSDQITAGMMNKLFSGLVQAGAWSCLDEFNRIDIEVLSVIAQQLLTIRLALLNKQEEFTFDGKSMVLKNTCGVFITMNPGYAGRTELPDNLKSLFRPVAMMIPDYALIAEIMLLAEGFENASVLSKKMVLLYKLSSEQLSQQDHYDFGMRAVKSLLVMAGSLKRQDPNQNEESLLILAMRDANIPKFLKDDLPLFYALIQDLFPGLTLPESRLEMLENQIENSLSQLKLQNVPEFKTKIIQLFDTINIRTGVMLVGQSGSGKSKCYQSLAHSISTIKKNEKSPNDPRFQIINLQTLNPKAISINELYGYVDIMTGEWQDGLASYLIRNCNRIDADDINFDKFMKYWIVFDGPVDSVWIENMNSVLDDSSTLCLANGERIKVRQELKMVFEVQDLKQASPATVSRCGMIYLNVDSLGHQPFLDSWINDLPTYYQKQLRQLFSNEWNLILTKLGYMAKGNNLFKTKNVCNYLKTMISQSEEGKTLEKFLVSVVWGLGMMIGQQDLEKFDLVLKDMFKNYQWPKIETVFDMLLDDTFQNFIPWDTKLLEFAYLKDASFFSLLVPTLESTKISYFIELLIGVSKPTFISGQTGVGKSVIITNTLQQLKEQKNLQSIVINFSAQTTAKETQSSIENKLYKKSKSVFGAKPNEKIVIFIDDINMPALEKYGAQPCIELLRQLQDQGGFYDRQKLFWKNIEDTTLLCSCCPPGGGRNELSSRFISQFNIINMLEPTDSTLVKIFGSILKGFLYSFNFSDSVRRSYDSYVSATIEIYNKISVELLPIPSKFHYTFNLRDISKVFQGMLMIKPSSCNSLEVMTRLWIHEMQRVFADRFINSQDLNWFFEQITEQINKHMRLTWTVEELTKNPIYFSDILKLEAQNILYEDVSDRKKVILSSLNDKQDDYNFTQNDKLELVFFDDAVQHVLRISRVLRQPRGNCMLIGVGGSGKQSLAKLASFLMKNIVFQIEPAKNYNGDSFKADIQKLMVKCGVDRQQIAFILTDSQLFSDGFLEDINNLLNSGEIPGLFSKKDDLDAVYNNVRTWAIKNRKSDSLELLWSYFIQALRENLHIILCMSPVGESLRIRCRKFPSLVNCCILDWFQNWPDSALLEVANKFLQNAEGMDNVEMKENLGKMCVEVSVQVNEACDKYFKEMRRRSYTTPKSYLDHIKLYASLLKTQRGEVVKQQKKLADGLDKLFKTNETVAQLKVEMVALQPKLEEEQILTDQFLAQLSINQAEANQKERIVNEEAQIVNTQALEVKTIAEEAQSELDKALPILKEAEEALGKINKNEIAEIKGFSNPPPVVVLVLEAVCVLLGEKTDWNSAKAVMVGLDFMDRLLKFDKNAVSDNTLRRLRQITNKPEFEPIIVGQKSAACKGLCMWCRAIDNFSKISKEVEPKKKKVAEMMQKMDFKNKELKVKQDELTKVRDAVAKLQKECDETVDRKNKLERELELTNKRLQNAEKLQLLLADEGIRWKEQIDHIDVQVNKLYGDIFLASSIIGYLGAFSQAYRDPLIQKWQNQLVEFSIPVSAVFSLANTLETPIKIRDYILQGLPNDPLSVDNAVIVTKCERWPLMIDPQGSAKKWIKNYQKSIKITKFTDPNYLKLLQNSIQAGYSILFEDIEEQLESSIDSVIQKQVVEIEGRKMIRVGDKRFDYNKDFQLFLTTKLSNPNYLPEVFIKVTVINFCITFDGLYDQLLSEVMKLERPDIEQQRDEIVVSISNSKKILKQAQDKILEMLATATGNILDNDELINTLEESKSQSNEIQRSLESSSEMEMQIDISRSQYKPVAIRGTVLYFVISDLAIIDSMYQFSLVYFKKVFKQSIQQTTQTEDLDLRIDLLVHKTTQVIFVDVCQGLFENHKKIFSFLIAAKIQLQKETIHSMAFNLFLTGPLLTTNQDLLQSHPNPDKTMFSQLQWNFALQISEHVPVLTVLCADLIEKLPQWKEYQAKEDLYSQNYPWNSDLRKFERSGGFNKLLVIKLLRPEKILQSTQLYVCEELGKFYEQAPSPHMEQVYQTSDCRTPVIFILSAGADPTNVLFKLSREKLKTLSIISLGQGQGRKAEIIIEKSQKEGNWVLLQNCHLAKSWMENLEKIVEAMQTENFNTEFRLFLTSMPASYFPVSVLQISIKLTTEPPKGLKANLKKSYQDFNQQLLDSCPEKPQLFRKLLFSLCFFHAIVQERRKFGSLGFNIPYEFNDSDLEISILMLKNFLNSQEEEIPWEAMIYTTGHINYGGRVTDDWDRVCLISILKKFYNETLMNEERSKLSDSGIYVIPEDGFVDTYRIYIQNLPNFEDPEVFGMNENANITYQQFESQKMIQTILNIQPKVSASSGKSSDQIVEELAVSLMQQLPPVISKEFIHNKHFTLTEQGSLTSMSTVFAQELDKFNNLLSCMKNSLELLCKAIKGLVTMSSQLDEMYSCLLNNQIPQIWANYSYETMKQLAQWFKDLIQRVEFIKSWGENPNIPCYWLPALFYPQGFLTAVFQTYSRKYQLPIDKLSFKFKIMDVEYNKIRAEPSEGVYIYGMFLEAAKFDCHHDTLTDASLGQLYQNLNIIHLLPCENYQAPEEYYKCPCYKTPKRVGQLSTTGQSTNFIMTIDLPTKNQKNEFWILRGTAILCQVNE